MEHKNATGGLLPTEETRDIKGIVILCENDSKRDESEELLPAEPNPDIEKLRIEMSRSSCQVRSFATTVY